MKIVIDDFNITISENNIHIEDSYKVRSRRRIKEILYDLRTYLDWKDIINTPADFRSDRSFMREWITHNNLYVLHFERERTKSVDLNYPQKWYVKIAYFLGSLICL